MRVKVSLLVLAGLLVAAVAIPAGSTAASKAKPIKAATCSASYVNPTPTKLKGVDFGFVSCKGYFGKGVQVVKYTEGVNAKTGAVTAHGPTTLYGDLGTMRGTYKLAGKLVGTTANLTGSGTITGGTGGYAGAKGVVSKLKCKTTNAGATYTCTYTVKLSKV